MHTFNQEIDTANIRRETLDGVEYAIAPIKILKPMTLNAPWTPNGAYLPQNQAEKSAEAWNGEPLTLGHPSTPDGHPTTANSPDMVDKTVIGRIFNASSNSDGVVEGEAWFNINKIRDMGGRAEKALERVLNGKSVSVSSGYLADRMSPGTYDGQHRNEVQGNIRPDHVAVLPNSSAKCDLEHGCGVGAEMAANSLITTNAMINNYLSEARTPSYDGTETSSWADVPKTLEHWTGELGIDAETVADMSQEEKQNIAEHTLLGDPEADSWQELSFFPVVNPANQNLNAGALRAVLSGRGESQESVPESAENSAQERARSLLDEEFDSENMEHGDEEMSENAIKRLANKVASYMNTEQTSNERAESRAETNDTMSERENHIEYLVENHDYEKDALESWDDSCLEHTVNALEDAVATQESTETEEETEYMEITENEFEDLIAKKVEERLAENEQASLIDEIVENSDEYDRETLEETPQEIVENIHSKVTEPNTVDYSATVSANAEFGNGEDDSYKELKMFGSDA